MKKQYIRPASQAIDLLGQPMMQAVSDPKIKVDREQNLDAKQSYSKRGGIGPGLWEDEEN